MRKKYLIPYIGILLLMIIGAMYVYMYENRSAVSFSAYCNIDFRAVREKPEEQAVAAVLAINDFSYTDKALKPECQLIIDGEAFDFKALKALKANPSYNLENYNKKGFMQYNNMLVFVFEQDILAKIAAAKEVRIVISYDNVNKEINLPLDEHDLNYWQNEIR